MNNIIQISILLPVFNRLQHTKSCLLGLIPEVNKKYKNVSFNIVVVDDGSSDGTSEWIKSNCSEVNIILGDGNLWWSGGINKAAKYAVDKLKTDYLLLWNNDILFHDQYFTIIDELIPSLDNDTIIGSLVLNENDHSVIFSAGGIFNPRSGKKYLITKYEQIKVKSGFYNVDWLAGMGTLIPSEAAIKLDYWNAVDFPQYYGDSDFTLRAKTAGYKIKVYLDLILYNKTEISGIQHNYNLKLFIKSFTDIRSKINLPKRLLFYKKHTTSIFAYRSIIKDYSIFILGFIKWNVIYLFKKKPR